MKIINRKHPLLSSILDDFLTDNRLDSVNYENFSNPKVNISETLTTFVLELAAPGLNKNDFAVEVEKDVLTVSSKLVPNRASSETEKNTQFTRKEFNYGSFKRSFTLSEAINVEDIKATYVDGILSITLPKLEVKKDMKKMVEIS